MGHSFRTQLGGSLVCAAALVCFAETSQAQSYNTGSNQSSGFQNQSTGGLSTSGIELQRTSRPLQSRRSILEERRGTTGNEGFVGRNQNLTGNGFGSNGSQSGRSSRRGSRSDRDRRDRGGRGRGGDRGDFNTPPPIAARQIQPRLQLGFTYTPRPATEVRSTLSTRVESMRGRFANNSISESPRLQNVDLVMNSTPDNAGVVTLRGTVNSESERRFMQALVSMEPGVSRVDNQLQVAQPGQ